MDDFQKSVFIEYFLNSIDLICEKSNADLVLDVFDSINQEFNLDEKTKEFKQTYFNPYKNLEERKIELAKDFFKKELLQIKKNLNPGETLKIDTGNIGVSPFPKPALVASNKFLLTIRPSVVVSVPKLIELNGTWAPALECIVFKLWINASIAW